MATTPEPLPLPPAAPEPGPLTSWSKSAATPPSGPPPRPPHIMLQVAGNATNGTAPEAVVAAASTAKTAGDAAINAKAIAQYGAATATAKQLTLQNSTNQSQTWAQLSPQVQEQLTQAGYKPPSDTSGSWWKTALGDVGKVMNYHPIHDVLN